MRKILITNDDGIEADGIVRLAQVAKKFGEVWVVAPESQRSAMSHTISLRESINVWPAEFPVEGVHAYKISGSPADCVRVGMPNIIKEKPDVVLSGINFGANTGTDTQYSATIGAAMEAATQGVTAIALSEGFDSEHEVTKAYLEQILESYIDRKLPFNQIWNINFPSCPLKDFKGILENRKVATSGFYIDTYDEEPLEDGGIKMTVHGEYSERADEGTDIKALVKGYISVSIVKNLCEV